MLRSFCGADLLNLLYWVAASLCLKKSVFCLKLDGSFEAFIICVNSTYSILGLYGPPYLFLAITGLSCNSLDSLLSTAYFCADLSFARVKWVFLAFTSVGSIVKGRKSLGLKEKVSFGAE